MKIPEWLPDTKIPPRPDGGSTEPIIGRLAEPFARFFEIEAAGGIVLLSCALILLWVRFRISTFLEMPAGLQIQPGEQFLDGDLMVSGHGFQDAA